MKVSSKFNDFSEEIVCSPSAGTPKYLIKGVNVSKEEFYKKYEVYVSELKKTIMLEMEQRVQQSKTSTSS
jgi:hypothetical protein